jgi:hypothetical protein
MPGMEPGFDMFSIMSTIFPLFFVLIFGFILFVIFKSIREWNNNNKQPRLKVDAKVVSKRTRVSGGAGDTSSSTSYFITFEVDSGDRMELHVSGNNYGYLAEGDHGELEFQGTRYLGFIRNQQVG